MSLNNFPKHQTVAWWIEQLQEMPNKNALVLLSKETGGGLYCLLSIYEGDKTVFIDIGEPENYD